jgi:hypothetical protein
VLKEQTVFPVLLERKELLVHKDHRALKEQQEHKELLVLKEQIVFLALSVFKELRVLKVHRALKVLQVHKVQPEPRV